MLHGSGKLHEYAQKMPHGLGEGIWVGSMGQEGYMGVHKCCMSWVGCDGLEEIKKGMWRSRVHERCCAGWERCLEVLGSAQEVLCK